MTTMVDNIEEWIGYVEKSINRAGPPEHVSEFERPQPVNLGRSKCAHCERWVTEAGKYDHNLSKHPEIYK